MLHLLAAVVLGVSSPSPGDRAFARGDFTEAFRAYNDAIIADADNADAVLGIGTLDLYRNDWRNARVYLRRALTLAPGNPLAEARLRTLARRLPKPGLYHFTLARGGAHIAMLQTLPVPVVRAVVNGHPLTLLVDTLRRSIDLTPAAAQTIGYTSGPLATVTFPGLRVRGVPARVLARPLQAGTMAVDGAIGTVFLTHFLPTFDYANHSLTLRRWEASPSIERTATHLRAASEPLWLVGDDLLLAQARVNGGPARLFALDTATAQGAALARDDAMGTATLSLGSYAVSAEIVPATSRFTALPFSVEGVLGNAFFAPAQVTFDFAAMRILIVR